MKMPNRQSAIRKDVSHRQSVKKKWDRHCKYSSDEDMKRAIEAGEALELSTKVEFKAGEGDNWIRLLDEGVVVDSDDWVFCVLEKGVIKRFYDELADDFEGYIDKDHVPAIYLGKYTKADLKLVNLPDERYALDVNLKLDKSLYAAQDLLKEQGHNAVSVEMYTRVSQYAKVSKVTGMSEKEAVDKYGRDYLVPVVDDIGIPGFAVCKAPKNANSYKDGLLNSASASEGEEMKKNVKDQEQKAMLEADGEAKAEAKAGTANEDEAVEDVEQENLGDCDTSAESKCEDKNNLEADEPEDKELEPETSAGDDGEEGKNDGNDEVTEDQLSQLEKAITSLKSEIKAKDAKIAELEAKIAETEKKETEKSANMSVSDRIAELLSYATSTDPSEAEGADKANGQSTSQMSEAERLEEDYRKAFADIYQN